MASWADVAIKVIEFLQKPSGIGVFLVLCFIAVGLYIYPLYIVDTSFTENTNRIIAAMNEIKSLCGNRTVVSSHIRK